MDMRLMPLSKLEFQQLAYDFAKKLGIAHKFNDVTGKAGGSFYYGFMKRHPDLALKKPNNTSIERVNGFNVDAVKVFFDKLIILLEEYQFQPSQIYNGDESGITPVQKNSKVISLKGKKNVAKMTSGEKGENVTVMLCGNAEGDLLPPFFILKKHNKSIAAQFAENLPPNAEMYMGSSSWQTTDSFAQWLRFFIHQVQPEALKPVLLIVDGHASHKTLDAITLAQENHVQMLSLPPNTTHKMQPLDRCFMASFKKAYGQACEKLMRELNGGKLITKDVSLLARNALNSMEARVPVNLIKGFQVTGIEPFDRDIFKNELNVAEVNQPESANRAMKSILNEIMPLPAKKPVKKTNRTQTSEILTSAAYIQNKMQKSRKVTSKTVV